MRNSCQTRIVSFVLQACFAATAFAQVPNLGPPRAGQPAASTASTNNSATSNAAAANASPTNNAAPPNTVSPANTAPVGSAPPGATAPAGADGAPDRPAVARVRKGSGVLPNDHGQVWREYDISPYTARVKQVERPEQAIIDWVLRETGTELWFSEPLGILSANRGTLRVYNTPDVQRVVASVVDRFVNSSTETQSVGLRLATIGSPNWRTRAYPIMRSVSAQAAGVEAWLLSKENAALLISELAKRPDYREYSTPSLTAVNGMQQNVARTRPRTYVKSFRPKDPSVGGYESDMAQLDEGFTLQVCPLFSLDARSVDLFVKCQVDQVEKFVPVVVDIPAFGGQWQRSQVQVPQLVSWRLNERFRWPTDQVLLLSCGVVASPVPEAKSTSNPLANLWSTPASRADALLFVECLGATGAASTDPAKATAGGPVTTRGRY